MYILHMAHCSPRTKPMPTSRASEWKRDCGTMSCDVIVPNAAEPHVMYVGQMEQEVGVCRSGITTSNTNRENDVTIRKKDLIAEQKTSSRLVTTTEDNATPTGRSPNGGSKQTTKQHERAIVPDCMNAGD